MAITRTSLLDLPIIETDTETGAWGNVVNNGLTQYLDIAIAGITNLTGANFSGSPNYNLTLTLTEGDSGTSNIVYNSAQYSTIKVSSLNANSTIIAPASSRSYKVINADSTYTLTIKATGQTGVTLNPGVSTMVVFNGTDYIGLGAQAADYLPLAGGTMTGAISFAAGQTWPTFNQNTTGNAATATTLQTARTINGTSFNGSANITVSANTTNTLTRGTYLTGSNFDGSAATTWAVDATDANTASKVVARDASGNFSAGTITAALSGNASTATTATNLAGGSAGTIPYQSAAGTTVQLAAGTSGYILQSNGAAAPSWVVASTAAGVNNGTLTMNVSGTGLSGSQTFTANQAGNATFTVTSNATSTNTASTIVARDASGNFSAGTITASLSGNASTSSSTTGNAATATALQTARTINGTSFNGSANITTANWGTARTLSFTGDVTGSSSVDGSANVATTMTLDTVSAAKGGTGQTTYAVGDLLYASATTTLSKLADVATGNALISGGVGVAPSYGKIGLTTHVSGTLPVANGGTGATTLTVNNVILGNGTSAVQLVAPSTSGNVLTSNGTTWASTAGAYRNLPPVGTKTSSYTLTTSDVGKYVQVGSGGSITIPNATFSEGDVVIIANNTSGNITITCTITTAYIAGIDSDKASVTLATRGFANIVFLSSTVCIISGNVT